MKLPEVKKYLKKEKLDAIVLFNKSPNFNYFVGEEFEHGMMFLTKKGNYLFLSLLYSPKFSGFKVVHWNKFKEEFKAFARKNRIKRAGIDNNNLLVKQKSFLRKHFELADCSEFLTDLRQSKTEDEIKRIKAACKVTDKIFSLILKNFSKFKTEKDIMTFIKIKALELADGISFEPIVASGSNAVVAHHVPDAKQLKRGFMVLDFGVKYKGYLSDMTRTVYIGKPSEKEKAIYNKVLEIQEACIAKAKIGLEAEKLYKHSLKLFGDDAKYFIHGLGHGIGVEIHEKPSLGKSKDALVKNDVFTIEPGYYNQKTGIGIRIEDDVLLLGKKKEVLTKSSKKLICVKP
ncbi:M24 family metallopeptidase [Candidatus Woesearchaeota archaeon]|nr:M24 family metallopeptidase [Candidatus Woesearchaeota archaeon]